MSTGMAQPLPEGPELAEARRRWQALEEIRRESREWRELELEDFDPTTGHLHACPGGACKCARALYAVAAALAEEYEPGWWIRFSYWIRPYDSHFDGRCWRWRRVRCRPWPIR